MVKLGSKAKDIITGFEGIVSGRTEWLYGCTRIALIPKELKDGVPQEEVWFDEQRIELIKESKPKISKDNSAEIGGPKSDPKLNFDPKL